MTQTKFYTKPVLWEIDRTTSDIPETNVSQSFMQKKYKDGFLKSDSIFSRFNKLQESPDSDVGSPNHLLKTNKTKPLSLSAYGYGYLFPKQPGQLGQNCPDGPNST